MALTKRQEIGARTILADGQIQVRVDTVIEEDGAELSRTHHRYVLEPGAAVVGEPAVVQRVANAEWTPAVIAAFEAKKVARRV